MRAFEVCEELLEETVAVLTVLTGTPGSETSGETH